MKLAVARILEEHHVASGVGIAVVTKDRILWTGGFGKADVAANRDVAGDTMFRVGSITKSFVALAALQLAEQRRLDLNLKVSEVAPEIPIVNPWKATNPVTLAQLLEHTAGFDDFSLAEFHDFKAPPEQPLRWTLTHFTEPERVRWKPGSRMSYSNPGYGLAGYIIERVAGVRIEDYIAANILRPVGMASSDIRLTPAVKAQLAQGYEDDSVAPYHPMYLRPAGEMKTSPNEMARFLRMMLNRGELDGVRIVTPESIARMETPETPLAARAGLKIGYGLGNFTDLAHPLIRRGHDGRLDGFISRYAYIPEAGVGYFFSLNGYAERVPGAIDDLLYNFVTRESRKPDPPPAVPLDNAASSWTGYYEDASPRHAKFKFLNLLTGGQWVSIKDHDIYVKPMLGESHRLVPVGPKLFRSMSVTAAGTIFATDDRGQAVMVATIPPNNSVSVYYERASGTWAIARLMLVGGAIAAMLSSIAFAAVWIPRLIFGRIRRARYFSVRIVPLASALVFVAAFLPQSNATPMELAKPNLVPLTLFLGSYLFVALSMVSAVIALRSFRWKVNWVVRLHSLLVTIACVGMTAYLSYWGMIGFRTWAPQ